MTKKEIKEFLKEARYWCELSEEAPLDLKRLYAFLENVLPVLMVYFERCDK